MPPRRHFVRTMGPNSADDITRSQLVVEIERLRIANRRGATAAVSVNPYSKLRPDELTDNVTFVLEQLQNFRQRNIGSVRTAVERRIRWLVGAENAIFVLGIVGGALLYFSAFSNGVMLWLAILGISVSASASTLVPQLHAQVDRCRRLRKQLHLWSYEYNSVRTRKLEEAATAVAA